MDPPCQTYFGHIYLCHFSLCIRIGLLKELSLRGNKLSSLPESIGSLKSLEKLNLSYNRLFISPERINKNYF
ncbi:MAG: hypothetical protein GF364_06285 [Candidatus Lokiarchaeota archaeon]|nr:hypothetical protein [Candidatus Lokiarchaeota archaeon]